MIAAFTLQEEEILCRVVGNEGDDTRSYLNVLFFSSICATPSF